MGAVERVTCHIRKLNIARGNLIIQKKDAKEKKNLYFF